MFKIALATAIALTAANLATAGQPLHQDERIANFCGADHVNEIAQPGDGALESSAYVISSMDVSLDPRDPRVVPAFVSAPYLCTEADGQEVKYLFVPSAEWGNNFAAP